MAIYKLGVIQPRFTFVGVEILAAFWFLWHKFGSRHATKPTKGSKDSDDSLVLTKSLSEKIGSLNSRQEPRKVGQKTQKTPPLVTSPQRIPNPKRKNFFSISTRRLAESVDGLNSFPAQSASEDSVANLLPKFWRARDLQASQKKITIFTTHIVESILSFSHCQNENECFFAKRQLQTAKWKNILK